MALVSARPWRIPLLPARGLCMSEHRIETTTKISAGPARVWSVLTDFTQMASWNPFFRSISGELRQGGRLKVEIGAPGKSSMTFKPVVLVLNRERELRWLGRLLLPGLFDGEHYFILDAIGNDQVRFTQGERFSGLLVGPLRGTLSETEKGFAAMNSALKARAES